MHKYPEKYERVLVRLGGFHIAENFMGAIGFFMKDSGLKEIMKDSGICRGGTANKILSGKGYYQMIRSHSIVCEAMIGLVWAAFEEWVESEQGCYHIIDLHRLFHQRF